MSLDYSIFKFKFTGQVHFGEKALENTKIGFGADTLFSALCIEAIKQGEEVLNNLIRYVHNNQLLISDAMPFIGKELYIPKPVMRIEKNNYDGNSRVKKKYKNMRYIKLSLLQEFLNGEYPIDNEQDFAEKLGKKTVLTRVALRGEEESLPYRVGAYEFADSNGLYIVAGFGNDKIKGKFEELMEALSLVGIGGKRFSGLGRFEMFCDKTNKVDFEKRLKGEFNKYMTLSLSLPREDELEKALQDAEYILERHGGFVQSDRYADSHYRKKDLFVFGTGACFKYKFQGDIYDVSSSGRHPVYRYAVPMFLGID